LEQFGAGGLLKAENNDLGEKSKVVNIFTDGACHGNPGSGGYGVVMVYGDYRKEHSGGFRKTTNNRMEIMGAIVGLEALKGRCNATVCSDSRYLVDAIILGWARKWKAAGWMRNSRERALNPDLWDRLLKLCDRHDVQFQWVRGHRGHVENTRCDELANKAASQAGLPADQVYEASPGTFI
jgi:ribonuclease HI